MNREKILLIVVLGLLLLLGIVPMVSPGYEAGRTPSGGELAVDVPVVEDFEDLPEIKLLRKLLVDWEQMMTAVPPSGRTILVAHSDLLPVEPAQLDHPAAMRTPVVLPPLSRFPTVGYYRRFRVAGVPPVTGGPAVTEEEFPEEGAEDGAGEEEALDEEEFAGIDAGIVLQAYIPDSGAVLEDLGAWSHRRHERAGGTIKVRLVKGANLAMEAVEAELEGWPQAPFTTKDARYAAESGSTNEARQWLVRACDRLDVITGLLRQSRHRIDRDDLLSAAIDREIGQ